MQNKKGKLDLSSIMTASVGSYPKPDSLYLGTGRQILDSVGQSFYKFGDDIGEDEYQERLDNAVLMAVQDQDEVGIEIVTDGEERRGHYVTHILRKVGGVDFDHWKPKEIREGRYVRDLPVVVDKIHYQESITVDEYKFIQQHTKGIAKVGLPGPITVVDTVLNEYYDGDDKQLAFDYAHTIRQEVKNLIEAGCRVIQFDDPVLIRYPKNNTFANYATKS
jgi:5-methyltetrahydropteroyltriglutamate--homocysteine methyltransferase